MKKLVIIVALLGFILLGSTFTSTMAANGVPPNPPPNYMTFTEDSIATPVAVDPAVAYDTASGEMIFNVYDTLISFNAEHLDQYVGDIADQWWSQSSTDIGQTISPAGLPWYWRYTFHVKSGINFAAPPGSGLPNYPLTITDIQYSFWRTMILDASGGPEWMLDEPLLNNAGGPKYLGSMANEATVKQIGLEIEQSVGANDSYVWFNIAFPSSYAPFPQILCQTWSSILSKQYINNQIKTGEGIADWNGNWADHSTVAHPTWTLDHTGWIDLFDVYTGVTGPLDVNSPHMYGSGPYILTNLNYPSYFWTMTRNTAYFRGWPADFPVMATVGPAGYCNTIRCNFGLGWAARLADLLSGACDFIAVPRSMIGTLYTSSTPPFNPPTNYPKDGIRCYCPLPTLQVDAMHFTFNIDPTSSYGPIYASGQYTDGSGLNVGIPFDFFSNALTGIHVRKGFAYAFDYAAYINEAWLGEAQHVNTTLIPGLPYYDPSVKGYDFDLNKAGDEFAQAGIPSSGFRVDVLFNTGNKESETAALWLQAGLAAINTAYVVVPTGLDWNTMLAAMEAHQAPVFIAGWQADYSDMSDFARVFYSGVGGRYPIWANWDNATLDADVNLGIQTPDGAARQAAYTQLAKDVIAFCPNVALEQPVARHFERDWVNGWYYNPLYPGIYYYNLWKWWYLPQADNPGAPLSDMLPADVTYDGKVNMYDVGIVAHCFGALRGPTIDPTWNFRCDVNLDGIINMKDIGFVARNFNATKVYITWHYP